MERIEFEDKEIICLSCEKPFRWKKDDQAFYHQKNLLPPKRCYDCREARKLEVSRYRGGNNG